MRDRGRVPRLLAWALVAAAPAAAAGGDDVGRDWYTDRAGPARTGAVCAAPIRAQPVVAWKRRLDEGVACAPVAWAGSVFALARTKSGSQVLYALDAATGEVRARTVCVAPVGEPSLTALQGQVVVAASGSFQVYSYFGKSFSTSWKSASPLLLALAAQGQIVTTGKVLRARDGRPVEPDPGWAFDPSAVCSFRGLTTITRGVVVRRAYVPTGEDDSPQFFVEAAPADKPGVAPWRWKVCRSPYTQRPATVLRLEVPGAPGAWLAQMALPVTSSDGDSCRLAIVTDDGTVGLFPVDSDLALHAGVAYAYERTGRLIAIGTDARYRELALEGAMPPGTARGGLSIAGDVLYAGNWAVGLDSRRVLWVHPVEASVRVEWPLVPVGDGLALLCTKDEIVCLADTVVRASAADTAAGAPPADAAVQPVRAYPRAVDGVLLADGRQVEGAASLDGAEVVVVPAGSTPRRFPRSEVVVAESGGKLLVKAPESAVFRVWREAFRSAVVPRLLALARSALDLGAATRARQLLDLARANGATAADTAAIAQKIASRREAGDAEFKMRELSRRESASADLDAAEVLAGAKWCGDRGLHVAGTALLALMEPIAPGRADVKSAVAGFVPPDFPFRKSDDVGRVWARWAPHLVVADATFLGPKDPGWQRVRGRVWSDAAIGIRTPHLLLFARVWDPDVVGPLLANGEAVVRALHVLLALGPARPPRDDGERLCVRLYPSRDEYLSEVGHAGAEFTLGCYSPALDVSSFFVPVPGERVGSLGRGLATVLAHELTHHFVESRWTPTLGARTRSSSTTAGHWVVEGLARFVEDQVTDAESRGLTYADATVSSVDAARQVCELGKLLPTKWLLDASIADFQSLPDEMDLEVRLRESLLTYRMSRSNVFYEQSAALVFWLWNGRGDAGRTALVEYAKRYYTGATRPGAWGALGFASAEELDAAFTAWLRALPR